MKRFCWWLTVCALMLVGVLGATAQTVLVNSGHVGAVTDLVYDGGRRLLFSAGADGTVRAWDIDSKRIAHFLRLSAQPVGAIALHPEQPLIAATTEDSRGAETLEVWNWRTGRRLFAEALDQTPLFLGFSSRGTSVIYTKADWDSVVFLDPATGRAQNRLREGFGIVSFVTTSTNERTIMTYEPSGRMTYWNAQTGRRSAAVTTLPNLDDIRISNDKRLLIARADDQIVAIDVVTGLVEASVVVPGQLAFAVSATTPELTVLLRDPQSGRSGNPLARRLSLNRGLDERWTSRVGPIGSITAAEYGGSSVFLADRDGIFELRPFGGSLPFVRNELLETQAIAVVDDAMVIAGDDQLAVAWSTFFDRTTQSAAAADPRDRTSGGAARRLNPPIEERGFGSGRDIDEGMGFGDETDPFGFYGDTLPPLRDQYGRPRSPGAPNTPTTRDSRSAQDVALLVVDNPFGHPLGLTPVPFRTLPRSTLSGPPVESGGVLVWNREGERGQIGLLDVRNGSFTVKVSGLPSPVAQASVLGDDLLVVQRSGAMGLYRLDEVLSWSSDAALPLSDQATGSDSQVAPGLGSAEQSLPAFGPSPYARFWAPGASKVASAGSRMIAGRTSAADIPTPLLQIDANTAETLPIADPALFVYDLVDTGGRLVTLGVEERNGAPVTVLKQHAGRNFRTKRTLDVFPGEDLFASLAQDPSGRLVYSSLGLDTVQVWDGNRLRGFATADHRPRQLVVVGERLYALNADGTLTVWNRLTGDVLFEFYLFRDFEWLAMAPSGDYYRSDGGERYVAVGSDG